MKVALIHDYLREFGGAERVLEALHQIFPDAPVYVGYYDPSRLGKHNQRFKDWDIRSTWIQKIPFADKFISPLRILAPMAFESLDLKEFDVVIISSNVYFPNAVITKPETLSISYIHTPPRYLYGFTTSWNYKKHWWTRISGELANHLLRIYDYEISKRPDILVANSKNIQKRIKKFYRRDSEVVYPPIDVKKFDVPKTKGDFFYTQNRLVRGKGVETVVEACTKLGVQLKVAGTGPEIEELEKIAGETVEFLGAVSDEESAKLYAGAKALIVASVDEDFGMTVVEAQAAGTPVIAMRAGGYLETVIEGKTGEFFDHPTAESLIKVLDKFKPEKYKATDCRKNAAKFSLERFQNQIKDLVANNYPKK